MRFQLRLRACSWILMNPEDIKLEQNTQLRGPICKIQKPSNETSFYTLLNMPLRFISQPQIQVQTLLSAHKGIQNHSLQFCSKPIHQKNETMA